MISYPLKLKPIYKHRIWGGQKLREVFGKNIPPGAKIGESWELSDLPKDKSVIINGSLAGQTLHSVLQQYPGEIAGDKNYTGSLPLLIKFLDAQETLSVQVHPDEKTCRRMGRGKAKTECWYILSAADGAVIYKGLRKHVTRDRFARAIQQGNVADLLVKVPVEPGQCHFLPAGTPHSIGAGLLIAEIQTPSDTTYRVFDWNRLDDTGRDRPLHIAEALESIHFSSFGDSLPVSTTGRLIDCEYFKVDKGRQAGASKLLLSVGQMKTLIILEGSGTIAARRPPAVEFRSGDVILVPAAYEGIARFEQDTQYLTVSL